jgi:hypothetical protein
LETRERYHRFLLRKVLDRIPNLHECGNPGCENAVIVEEDGKCGLKNWTCDSCAKTCPFCKKEAHEGKKCAAERKFVNAEKKQKLWVRFSRSKRCPGNLID